MTLGKTEKYLEPMMPLHTTMQLPETYQKNLHKAVSILKQAGCKEIFLFGSLATAQFHDGSDIDLAIRGCPKGKFFHLLGQLMFELDYPVDLVNLESSDAFAQYLEQEGELRQVG